MTFSEQIAEWTDGLTAIANIILILAGLLGVALVFRSLTRAYQDTKDGRSPIRHYAAAGIAGAITVLGVIAGIISNLVV